MEGQIGVRRGYIYRERERYIYIHICIERERERERGYTRLYNLGFM